MCPTHSGSNGTTDGFSTLYAPRPDFKAQKLLDIALTILIALLPHSYFLPACRQTNTTTAKHSHLYAFSQTTAIST
jgi:hypothetical protein